MSIFLNELIKDGYLTQDQLNDAKAKQIGAKRPLHELIVEMGFTKEEDLMRVAEKVFKIPFIDLSKEAIDPEVVAYIPYEVAKRYGVFPMRRENNFLSVAMADPQDFIVMDDLKIITKLNIRPVLCTKNAIDRATEHYYRSDERIYSILKNSTEMAQVGRVHKPAQTMLAQSLESESAPIVKLCNLIITDAIRYRASDIHIEAQDESVLVRYRIDGDLRNIIDLPITVHDALVARIKILCELDISENRKPQDGRSEVLVNGKKIDLRVSTIPAFLGEKVEIRILDSEEAKISLDKIGISEREARILKEAFGKPQGMILMAGPTGSGKTSTLYAALSYVKNEKKNIVTIEYPVEYLIEGINQMQINPIKDVTFATGLRHILRQDPNVILVGEIRDKETAEIAFQASQTGHLVFSTVHSNDAVTTVTRLLDIGLAPYVVASSIILIAAQRLMKTICIHCKEQHEPPQALRDDYKKYIDMLGIRTFYYGKGCDACSFTGYLGRTGIFELMPITDSIKRLIAERAPEDALQVAARDNGLLPLVYTGMEKVAAGVSTLEEVQRVVGIKDEDRVIKQSRMRSGACKILIADDEEDILKVLAVTLQKAGYNVILTRDGVEALEKVHREKPDLVISDVTMPKMNGYEMVRGLRSRLETVAIPVIMLTARSDKASEIEGLDAGADDYIVKPFDGDKLLARIRLLLKRRDMK